jgi:peptidyl-prolyl cis-trans isomerase SurA
VPLRGALCALALLIGGALSPWTGAVHGQVPAPAIAVVVNDDIVTTQELVERVELSLLVAGLPTDAETKRRLAPQVVRGLIDERLQKQEARRLNLSVTDAELDRAMADIAARNGMTAAQLESFLGRRGISTSVLRDQLAAQIAWLKVTQRTVRPRVVVTEEQVDLALRLNESGESGEVLLSEIIIPVYQPDQEPAARDGAEAVVRALAQGADFAALAREISAAPSAENGGDLGWLPTAALPREVQAVVAQLPIGTVSEPLRTSGGFALVLVRDRRDNAGGDPEAQREAIRTRLREEQFERLAGRYLRELRRSAYIDIRL